MCSGKSVDINRCWIRSNVASRAEAGVIHNSSTVLCAMAEPENL